MDEDDILAGTTPDVIVPESTSLETDDEPAGAAPVDAPAAAAATPVDTAKVDERKRKSSVDEKKRSARLFGNILGTLSSFKKEEKARGASDAAQRRSAIAERIQTRLRTETSVLQDLASKEREIRAARAEAERKEASLLAKDRAYAARHALLPRLSTSLCTSSSAAASSSASGPLRAPLPLLPALPPTLPPIARAAFRPSSVVPSSSKASGPAPPLYFLPAVLLPAQEELIAAQVSLAAETVSSETLSWSEEKARIESDLLLIRAKESKLATEISELRRKKAEFDAEAAGKPIGGGAAAARRESTASATVASAPLTEAAQVGGDQKMDGPVADEKEEEQPATEVIGDTMMEVEGDEDVEY